MATTTNYGWTTPDDTDLVKDGAAAIRSLGSSIDTTTKNLNPSTTLGDIEYRSSTANTNTRLGIGTSGQVLTVSGGVPAWTTISSGGLTQIATGTLSSTQVNIQSIPGTYKHLQLLIRNYLPATDNSDLYLRFNADTANRYNNNVSGFPTSNATFGTSFIPIQNAVDNTVDRNLSITNIYDYANTATWKLLDRVNVGVNATTTTNLNAVYGPAYYNQTGAITEINLLPQTGSFTSGTYILYGVN